MKPSDADFVKWVRYASDSISSIIILLKSGRNISVSLPRSIVYNGSLDKIKIQEAGYFPNHITIEEILVSDIEQISILPSA